MSRLLRSCATILPMRLTDEEIQAIRQTFRQVFGEGEVYLFGSRTDDSAKGGDIDIDLYLKPVSADTSPQTKVRFLVALENRIGEQRIDVIMAKDPTRLNEREAMRTGIRL